MSTGPGHFDRLKKEKQVIYNLKNYVKHDKICDVTIIRLLPVKNFFGGTVLRALQGGKHGEQKRN